MTVVHHPENFKAKRLLLAGAGTLEKFTSAELRRVAGTALRHLKSKSLRNIAIALDSGYAGVEHVSAAVEGALAGDFEPDRYKTDKKDAKGVDRFTVAARGGGAELQRAMDRGGAIGEAQTLARELVNEPANRLTPTVLAEAARQMASAQGLEC